MAYFRCRTRIQIGLGFQTLWLHSIMQNIFPLTGTGTQIHIPFPNGYCAHCRDRSLFQGQISIPITYISIRGSESESELMEKYCIVQQSESESESEFGNGNKPLSRREISLNLVLIQQSVHFLPRKRQIRLLSSSRPLALVVYTYLTAYFHCQTRIWI